MRRETHIEHAKAILRDPNAPVQPRSEGAAAVSVRADNAGRTEISTLRQSGALKLVFPRTYSRGIEAISVNTGGGLTGGDRFETQASVGSKATLTITTQAAERAYRAQPGEIGRVTTTLDVAEGGRLNWLPQELILYDGAALHRRLNISLTPDARLLMVEPLVFGRAAMGERLNTLSFKDRIRITRADLPLYIDGLDLTDTVTQDLARSGTADGAGAMVSLVHIDPQAARHLDAVRALLPATGGASMLAPDMMTLRLVAPDSLEMRRALVPILDLLTDNQLPLSWRL